ncbi:MAG TPA: phosphoglycerate kinase [Patescibacteria group bacterium]
MRTLEDVDVKGKKVLLRLDLDVPLKDGFIVDDSRIVHSKETLQYLIEKNCPIIVIGHMGRPEGRFVSQLTTEPLAKAISDVSGTIVTHFATTTGTEVENAAKNLKPKEIILLENLRFFPGEEGDDPNFAQALAKLAEIYVFDAFGVSHRNHASVVGIPKLMPAVAGLRFGKEVQKISRVLENPKRPFVAIVGGAKVETKMPVVENLAKIADYVLVGGKLPLELKQSGENFELPQNAIVAELLPSGGDLAPEAIDRFCQIISNAQTIVWDGPMGAFEQKEFAVGTSSIAAEVSKSKAETIVGGGDTVAALSKFGYLDEISWVSSGGGAMLEFLSGKKLSAIEALEENEEKFPL